MRKIYSDKTFGKYLRQIKPTQNKFMKVELC